MIFTSPKDISKKSQDKASVFLAGSMASSSENNWRQLAIDQLKNDYHLFDPTNPKHDILNDGEMRTHIKWELDALKTADYIILNFLPESQSPISMVELGMYISSKKLVVICPTDFYKWRYIDTLCKQYNTPIFNQLEQVLTSDFNKIINE